MTRSQFYSKGAQPDPNRMTVERITARVAARVVRDHGHLAHVGQHELRIGSYHVLPDQGSTVLEYTRLPIERGTVCLIALRRWLGYPS